MLVGDREREASKRPMPIDVHGAGAALALVAAFLASAQRELFAQRVQQGRSGIELETSFFSVDAQLYTQGGAGLV